MSATHEPAAPLPEDLAQEGEHEAQQEAGAGRKGRRGGGLKGPRRAERDALIERLKSEGTWFPEDAYEKLHPNIKSDLLMKLVAPGYLRNPADLDAATLEALGAQPRHKAISAIEHVAQALAAVAAGAAGAANEGGEPQPPSPDLIANIDVAASLMEMIAAADKPRGSGRRSGRRARKGDREATAGGGEEGAARAADAAGQGEGAPPRQRRVRPPRTPEQEAAVEARRQVGTRRRQAAEALPATERDARRQLLWSQGIWFGAGYESLPEPLQRGLEDLALIGHITTPSVLDADSYAILQQAAADGASAALVARLSEFEDLASVRTWPGFLAALVSAVTGKRRGGGGGGRRRRYDRRRKGEEAQAGNGEGAEAADVGGD